MATILNVWNSLFTSGNSKVAGLVDEQRIRAGKGCMFGGVIGSN